MVAWPESDIERMQAALAEADRSAEKGEIPVGAILVLGDTIVGRGHNQSIADNDPSGHAEIVALRDAGKAIGNHRLTGGTLYVTLEPCAMCIAASAQARVSRIVFGAYDPKAGAAGSAIDLVDSPALNHRMEVNGGLLEAECGERLKAFFAARR